MIDLERSLVYVATGNNYAVPADVAACQALTPDNPMCNDPGNHIDSVVALDLSTGSIRWTFQAMFSDNSTNGCLFGVNCESPRGPDHDFAQAPLFVDTAFGPVVFAGQLKAMKRWLWSQCGFRRSSVADASRQSIDVGLSHRRLPDLRRQQHQSDR